MPPFPARCLLAFTLIATGVAPAIAHAAVDVSAVENLRPALPNIPDRTFTLTDFGAVGDGRTMNTAAFH